MCYTVPKKSERMTAMKPTMPPPILTAAEMRACDGHTIEDLGIPSRTLMERAARKAAAYLLARTDLFPAGRVLLLCGGGNNGGDGFAMARFLTDGSMGDTRACTVVYVGRLTLGGIPDEARMSEECARQYRLAIQAKIPVRPATDLDSAWEGVTAVVDAVIGIGLERPVTGDLASLLLAVRDTGLPVLAMDIPSGVNADTGEILGVALPAAVTVTMQALKRGLLLYPGADICGEILVCDLGIDLSPAEGTCARLADDALLHCVRPPRGRRTHKGTYGRLALLCGSEGMSGAAVLATRAALRTGVGLAHVLTPEANRPVLQITVPEAIVSVYASPDALSSVEADALVLGCGLGTSALSREALRALVDRAPARSPLPAVLDADALNLLSADPSLWETSLLAAPDTPVVITPHPAEMARLCGKSIPEILASPVETAQDYARAKRVTVVLKDAHTVIASPEGELYICAAGNAGMAKGGSGDVLAGVIGALLTQCRERLSSGLSVAAVAAAGVYLHAAAGDLAARALGEYGMLASDVIERLPCVCRDCSDSTTKIAKSL